MKYILKFVKIITAVLVITITIRIFLFSPSTIDGRSMEPTLLDSQWILVSNVSLLFSQPQKNDIVQIIHPEIPQFIVKRIIATPGDTVIEKEDSITVMDQNNEIFTIYLNDTLNTSQTTKRIKIEKNEYYILGDNYNQSVDSRNFGPIHRSLILGEVIRIPAFK